MAGVMKRKSEDLPEAVVLMRVLRDMNFPKFVFEDVPLFLGLIKVRSRGRVALVMVLCARLSPKGLYVEFLN